jgi:hypothetical protein
MIVQKIITAILIFSFISIKGISQNTEKISLLKSMEVSVGTKIRVTPIHLVHPWEGIVFYQFSPFEQPDDYLSGWFSLFVDEKFKISNSFSIVFHQSVRRDYFVEHLKFGSDYPYVSEGIERRFMYDIYSHLLYDIRKKKEGKLYLSAGFGFSGLNTGHKVELRYYTSNTTFIDSIYRNNFVYPTASLGIKWERKKIGAGLIIGYCWKDPTFFRAKFLLPEISLHYKLFGHKKED